MNKTNVTLNRENIKTYDKCKNEGEMALQILNPSVSCFTSLMKLQ